MSKKFWGVVGILAGIGGLGNIVVALQKTGATGGTAGIDAISVAVPLVLLVGGILLLVAGVRESANKPYGP